MNRILVTQGHEDSISLEVFIKSFLLLEECEQKRLSLYCFKPTLDKTMKSMGLHAVYEDDYIRLGSSFLKLSLLDKGNTSQSYASLSKANSDLKQNDILLTLPTSKSEINDNKTQFKGHTDYLRKTHRNEFLTMLFVSEHINMALLTEHISLSEVENSISTELICKKVKGLINGPIKFKNYIFTGINPHCGEDGIIAKTDSIVTKAISILKEEFPDIRFKGPMSGDTILLDSRNYTSKDCIISPFHDQGLSSFKAVSGMRASNITIGLPFVRLSPDHGTAFDLYGKNKANYFGAFYTIKTALKLLVANEHR